MSETHCHYSPVRPQLTAFVRASRYLSVSTLLSRCFAGQTPDQAEIDGLKSQGHEAGVPLKVGFNFQHAGAHSSHPARPRPTGRAPLTEASSVMCIRSNGAGSLQLHLEGLGIPKDTAVYTTCSASETGYGPITGTGLYNDGKAWAHSCEGNEVCIHVVSETDGKAKSSRGVAGFVAGYKYVTTLDDDEDAERALSVLRGSNHRTLGHCSGNASCIQNAECTLSDDVTDVVMKGLIKDAVGRMIFVSGRFVYLCTGGLIANTGPHEKLYFLTANHCVSKGKRIDIDLCALTSD